MRKYLILFLILFILVGCNGKEEALKGGIDVKGVITDIDSEGSRILVEDADKDFVWIAVNENDPIENYKEGQELVIWIDGGMDTSSPASAKALNIEVLEKEQESLPKFDYKNHEFPPKLTGFIRSGESRYEMAGGGYSWSKDHLTKTEVVQTDHAGPNQIAENFEAIVLDPGSQVSIEIEQDPNLRLYLWTSDETSETLEGKEITVPENKGRYIYEVVAKWSNGEVSFTIVIEVQ